MYRSMLAAGVLERLAEPDELGRRVRLTVELQNDFALNQPLSLFVLEAVPRLDLSSPDWELDVVSVVESTLEDPRAVLAAQLERLRTETLARLKEEGMEYEDRMEVLRELEHPKPLAEFLYDVFDQYRVLHPWARDHNVSPEISCPRYVRTVDGFFGVRRLLRCRPFRGAVVALPFGHLQGTRAKRPRGHEVFRPADLTEWLGEMVRQVDSSLLDEWELLSHPQEIEAALARGERPPCGRIRGRTAAAHRQHAGFQGHGSQRLFPAGRTSRQARLGRARRAGPGSRAGTRRAGRQRSRPTSPSKPAIGTGPEARGPALWQLNEQGRQWRARQVLDDPAGYHEWAHRCRHRPRRFGPKG